jgi:hypothetical protein
MPVMLTAHAPLPHNRLEKFQLDTGKLFWHVQLKAYLCNYFLHLDSKTVLTFLCDHDITSTIRFSGGRRLDAFAALVAVFIFEAAISYLPIWYTNL